jgi:hypothetical protein
MAEPTLSAAEWRTFLSKKLDAQTESICGPSDYYNGLHKLAFATAKFKEAFSRYFPPMANNWMKLIVDSPVARLRIEGFRFDPDPEKATWDVAADTDAWEIWKSNNLPAVSKVVHTEAIKCGVCNVLVSPGEDGDPLITAEHPGQSYVFSSYTNRRRRLAAIKRYIDELDEHAYCFVYLPGYVYRYRSLDKVRDGLVWNSVRWGAPPGEDPVTANPMGVVPMISIENNPDLLYGGRSDLEVAMPIQDAINKLCLDMQVSSEYHAYPQRWASGWETANDPEGNPIPGEQVEMRVGQSRLVRASSPDTKFGTFQPGEVDNYIKPIELYIDHLAAVTQTPAYYLKGKMANLSAEALKAADQGFVDRIEGKLPALGDGWDEVMRVAFLAKGDTKRGKAKLVETIWANPETVSLAQVVDAAVKMRTSLSTPVEFCWEMIGWSQQRIMLAKTMMNLPTSPAHAAEQRSPEDEAARRAQKLGLPAPGTPAAGPGGVVLPNSSGRV